MKQLEVQIMGQNYLLVCPDGGDSRLLEAVERVDTAMCKVRDAGKIRARDRIAVLAALNLAFDLSDQSPYQQTAIERPSPVIMKEEAPVDVKPEGRDLLLNSLLVRLDAALGEDDRLF